MSARALSVADLVLITAASGAAELERVTRAALAVDEAPRLAVQLRAPHLTAADREALGQVLRAMTLERGAALFVNGDAQLALRLNADGLHLPERASSAAREADPWAPRPFSMACHDAAGLGRASARGARFALLSPVFEVVGKSRPLGAAGFGALARTARVPVHALGGVGPGSAAELVAVGAAGVAVIRAVFGARDPTLATQALLCAIDQGRTRRVET